MSAPTPTASRASSPLSAVAALAVLACGAPVAPTVHGVPNLRTVDATAVVYRSGQPAGAESWAYLRTLGVATVLKLDTDAEGSEDGAEAAGLVLVRMPWPPANAEELLSQPAQADIHRAADILRAGHVLVHCKNGWDRTGLAVEAFRTLVQGWPRSRAHREALNFGFHEGLLGLDDAWQDLRPYAP